MDNIYLKIAYDGSKYLGWQKTEAGPSIEETLKRALETALQHEVTLQAASRTDAGVHAKGQVVNFFTYRTDINLGKLLYNLNTLLPKDIVGWEIKKMGENFHPTLDCRGKEYHYFISFGKIQYPVDRFYSWHYPYPLDLKLMEEAAGYIIGTKDFSVFCNAKKNANYTDLIREVSTIQINQVSDQKICLVIKGKNFLYKMVRNIAGTLAYIGSARLDINDIEKILESKDRKLAGVTAPAHGLFLKEVFY